MIPLENLMPKFVRVLSKKRISVETGLGEEMSRLVRLKADRNILQGDAPNLHQVSTSRPICPMRAVATSVET
jgi:hypothetical protein